MAGMRAVGIIVFATLLLLFGCASQQPTPPNAAAASAASAGSGAFTTDATVTNEQGQNINALPAAHSGEDYFAGIYPNIGTPHFTCMLAPGSNLPGELSFGGNSCEIAGKAPELSAGGTRAAYPFSFIIKDSKGVEYGPYPLTLEIVPYPPDFIMQSYPGAVPIGRQYDFDFCSPPSSSPLNCGKDPASNDPSNGIPPYTFTASNLPLGLIMRSDGHLSGVVPKGAKEGPHDIEVCAADSTGTTACQNTSVILMVLPEPEEWKGTFTGTLAYPSNTNDVMAGAKYALKYDVDFLFPQSLSRRLDGTDKYGLSDGNGTMGGSWTVISQTKWGSIEAYRIVGGSKSGMSFHLWAGYADATSGALITIEAMRGSNMNFALGHKEHVNHGVKESETQYFADELSLRTTSISEDTVTGTWSFGEGYDTRPYGAIGVGPIDGAFTLTRVK
ncbi:MAG: putative Ig domain-containing protein [Candidatus Micrarchaeota archaeon]